MGTLFRIQRFFVALGLAWTVIAGSHFLVGRGGSIALRRRRSGR